MKKLFYLFIIIPIIALGASSTGVGVDKTSASLVVPMGIFDILWINVQSNTITWDFTEIDRNDNNPPFPPTSFPEYYEPSRPNRRSYQRIRYRVRGFLWPAGRWEVTIFGAGNPSPDCGILLSDIEYGDAAAGNWIPLNMTPQVIASGNGDIGWTNLYQDYRVKMDGDESSTAGSSTTVTYMIQIL
jgi:hypothetical protein